MYIKNRIFVTSRHPEGTETLQEFQALLTDPTRAEKAQLAILTILMHIFQKVPLSGNSTLRVPLPALIADYAHLVAAIIPASQADLPVTYMKAMRNGMRLSGIVEGQQARRPFIVPMDYDGDPTDYLEGTGFEDLLSVQVPFGIPRDRWSTHAVVLAPSEWGKSQLTGMFLREALEDPEERAVILCDPHGDLYNEAAQRVDPERLVTVDLTTNPPDLNILDDSVMSDRAALETFRFLMSSLAGGLSPKQETCVKPLFGLLRNIPGATLVTLHEIITEQAKRPTKFAEPISRLDDIQRVFFENLWYTGNFSETREALTWKVSSALDDAVFKKMFSAKTNSLDVSRWIEEKKVVLIKSGNTLDKQGTQLFFLYILGQYYAAAKRRDAIPVEKRHLAMMLFDEASVVLSSPLISDILVEIRKYNCSFYAATQLWAHVADDVRPAVLGSTGIRIVGQLGLNEGKAVGPDMGISSEQIKALRNVPGKHAEWYFYVRSVSDIATKVTAPYGVLARMPEINQPATSFIKPEASSTRTHEGPSKPEMKTAPTIPAVAASTDPPIVPDDDPVMKKP